MAARHAGTGPPPGEELASCRSTTRRAPSPCDHEPAEFLDTHSVAVRLVMIIRRGTEVVVASGPDPRPLGGRAAVQPELPAFGIPMLRPALRRVLPELLPTVD